MAPLDRARYDSIRNDLDTLGYQYAFPPESLPLVEQLTADILAQREKLENYERILAESEKERESLKIGVEPYRRDNARLLTDNLELQKTIEQLQDRHESEVKTLRQEVQALQDEVSDLDFISSHSAQKIGELEQEVVIRDIKILELTSVKATVSIVGGHRRAQGPVLELSEPIVVDSNRLKADGQSYDAKTLNIAKMMENRAANLAKQMKELKDDNCKLSGLVVALKREVRIKDVEIARLKKAVEGGRPIERLQDPCCCWCKQKDAAIEALERRVREAVDKQHEAMTRAVQLAERNQLLERELKDLGTMTTSLEETYKRDSKQKEVETLQQRLDAAQREIKDLETRLKEARDKSESEEKTNEKLRREKRNLEQDLNNCATEKKALNDRINKLVLSERELHEEVDRLKAANQTLHRRWSEKDPWQQCADPACRTTSCPCKCPSPSRARNRSPLWKSKRLRDKTEPKFCGCAPSLLLLDKLQQERDYYHQECHILRERLCEKCACNQTGKKDNVGERTSAGYEGSLKLLLERVERERDMALADLRRAQEERDCLRDRIKISDNLTGAGMSGLAGLERQCEDYQRQLRTCQAELAQVSTLYAQLKALHDQTDRTYAGSQARFTQLEAELMHAQNKLRDVEKTKWDLEERVSILSREKMALTQTLAHVEKEKDELVMTLDDKTERLARMEKQLKKKEAQIAEATDQIAQAHKKFELTLSEKVTRDHAYRTLELTLERVRLELTEAAAAADTLRADNRRLQDELSAALRDGHTAHKDVDLARVEVANLKRQLQQYVTRVERAEELISKKEREQEEMLRNFQTLSLEATSLEDSHHTLESEMEVTKMTVQDLSMQVQELQSQLKARDGLVTEYEKQIASLSQNIAELEARLDVKSEQCVRLEKDLDALHTLCSTLDGQRENLQDKASSVDRDVTTLTREVRRLSEEKNGLSEALERERTEVRALRESLSHSRQETMKHQSSNKDLTTLVHELRRRLDELTSRLDEESQKVRRYEEQCSELNGEVVQLRRDVTNLRFESARSSHDRIEEPPLLQVAQSPDPRWKMPPLPLPRSSDVSPVSSDMYISPLESELPENLNGHFSPKEPTEEQGRLFGAYKDDSAMGDLPLRRPWASGDPTGKESRFETFCLKKTCFKNMDSFGRVDSTQSEDRESPLGTYRVMTDRSLSWTASQVGSPRQRILSDIEENNSSSGDTTCQCLNRMRRKNCKKRTHTPERRWYD